jgi:hypothetical protein
MTDACFVYRRESIASLDTCAAVRRGREIAYEAAHAPSIDALAMPNDCSEASQCNQHVNRSLSMNTKRIDPCSLSALAINHRQYSLLMAMHLSIGLNHRSSNANSGIVDMSSSSWLTHVARPSDTLATRSNPIVVNNVSAYSQAKPTTTKIDDCQLLTLTRTDVGSMKSL